MAKFLSKRNPNHKAPFGTIGKHRSTQTNGNDFTILQDGLLTLSDNKNSIRNSFYKQAKKNSSKSNASKFVQTLLIRPLHESTPERKAQNDLSDCGGDDECAVLVENVTPIKELNKSCIEISDSPECVTSLNHESVHKSTNDIPSRNSDNQSSNIMLSLDETLLKSINLDQVEETYLNSNNEISSGRCEERSHSPDVFANEDQHACQNEKNAGIDTGDCFVHPSTIKNISRKHLPKLSQNQLQIRTESINLSQACASQDIAGSQKTEVHLDIDNIDWGNDSLMNRALTQKMTSKEARESGNVKCKKRLSQVFEVCKPVCAKRSKQVNDTSHKVAKDKENFDTVGKELERMPLSQQEECNKTQQSNRTKNSRPASNIRSSQNTNMNNCNEMKKKIEETKNPTISENNNILCVPEKRTSATLGRVRRSLITNAQSPVTNAEKPQDSFLTDIKTLPDTSANFELGPFFGLPSKVKVLIEQYKGISKLYDWQEECLNLEAVQGRKNLVYALPTSGGKTLVAEILILRELLCAKSNALFVLPYVSIVQEKVNSLAPFALALDFLVEEYAAGKGQYPPKKRRRKQSVYVATIEKAHSLVNSLIEAKRIAELGLVVVDELHLLGSESGRGATLEGMLTKLLFCCEGVHIVGMSATIGNIQEVASFLQAEVYSSNFRPVELKEYVKCEDKLYAVNWQPKGDEEVLKEVRRLNFPYSPSMVKVDPDRVGALVLEVVPEHSCLVFCATKKGCENVANMIVKIMPKEMMMNKTSEKRSLCKALSSEAGGEMCHVLKNCIPFGVAYHHSGLTVDERRLLEDAYRAGTLCCICCTSTLAAGVNLPAKRVILRSPSVGREFINLSQYKQMVGRAGRAGLEDAGESILLCQEREMQRVKELLTSEMDVVLSKLHASDSRGLPGLVMTCVGLGIATSRSGLQRLAQRTLLSVQAERLDVSTELLVGEAVRGLFRIGILDLEMRPGCRKQSERGGILVEDGDSSIGSLNVTAFGDANSVASLNHSITRSKHKTNQVRVPRYASLKITRLGKAAMKGSIEVHRANQLYGDLVQAQSALVLLSCLHLLYLVTPYDAMDIIRPDPNLYFAAYSKLNAKDIATARILGLSEACMLRVMKGQKPSKVPETVIHRFYLTLILNDLWNHTPVWEVAEKYTVPRGTLQNLMTSAASFASCILHFCEELEEFWAFKQLLISFTQRLSHCCSADLLPLMELPAVKIGRAKQLYIAGFKTLKDIANAEPNTLVESIEHMPRATAKKIVAAAKFLLVAKAESLREEAEEVIEGLRLDQSETCN